MKVAIYARVSTKNGNQNPELQLTELREYARARRWQVAAEFVDVGVSGAKDSLPQLDALIKLPKARRIDDYRLEAGSLWTKPEASGHRAR